MIQTFLNSPKKQLLDVNLKHYTLDEKRYESKIITVFEMKNHQSKLIGETCIYIYIYQQRFIRQKFVIELDENVRDANICQNRKKTYFDICMTYAYD